VVKEDIAGDIPGANAAGSDLSLQEDIRANWQRTTLAVERIRPWRKDTVDTWAQKEMDICANCLAVAVDQRL
jgi:hypothetical protein